MSDLQDAVALWFHVTFGGSGVLNSAHDALAVMEEAGEIARAVLKRDQARGGVDRKKLGVDHWSEQVRIEACDTLITLLSLAANEGFDLLAETNRRFAHIKTRGADD